MNIEKTFAAFANKTSRAAGRPWTFALCVALVLIWAATGPIFRFSETWQLVINTATTIVTFLMVFLIQNTQNRDNAAIQAKLDDLILTSDAEDEFVGIEEMTEAELWALHERCLARAKTHEQMHAKVKAAIKARAAEHTRQPATRKPARRKAA